MKSHFSLESHSSLLINFWELYRLQGLVAHFFGVNGLSPIIIIRPIIEFFLVAAPMLYQRCTGSWWQIHHHRCASSILRVMLLAVLLVQFWYIFRHNLISVSKCQILISTWMVNALLGRYSSSAEHVSLSLSVIDFFWSFAFCVPPSLSKFFNQGVAKLPFIDEKKLLTETKKLEQTLTVGFLKFFPVLIDQSVNDCVATVPSNH